MSCEVASRMVSVFMFILISLGMSPWLRFSTVGAIGPQGKIHGRQNRSCGRAQEPNSMIVNRVELGEIQSMRDIYRHEMHCQIIFDSIHIRPGWTLEYLITEGESKLGYGSVAVAGPWQAKPTVYEFFLLPQY